MGEKPPVYATNPDLLTRLLAVLEDAQWARVLFHLSAIIHGTGWGEVTITIKKGKVDSVSSTMRELIRED